MSLANYTISAQVAVSDMARAVEFYEGKLGLSADERPGGTRRYLCADGTSLYVYAAPANAGTSTATLARWDVDDIERVVDELSANGVAFELYGEPVKTSAKGIHDSGYSKVAWFKDPDGNTFALEQT